MNRARLALVICLFWAIFLPALRVLAEDPEGPRSRSDMKVSGHGADGPDLGTPPAPAYRLEFTIRGGAISRVLLLFPLRVFFEASAAVDLKSIRQENGSTCFEYPGLPRPAYILRTLGFGGKTLALLLVDGGEGDDGAHAFTDDLLARWRKQAPEFAAKAAKFKKFPHRLLKTGPQPFSFRRDASGAYRDIILGLEPRYRHHPARTGIYFNVFPLLAHLLTLLNQRFMPGSADQGPAAALPTGWSGEDLDLSASLNRLAGLLEKVVRSLVTVEQKFPFRQRFHAAAKGDDELEICGEAFPDVPLWKGFMIREVFRRVRLRPLDGELLSDEIWLGLRSKNGQGGSGRLRLERIATKEDDR